MTVFKTPLSAVITTNREARVVRFCFCLLISVVREFPTVLRWLGQDRAVPFVRRFSLPADFLRQEISHGAPLARLSQNREARVVRFCFCLLISVVRKFPTVLRCLGQDRAVPFVRRFSLPADFLRQEISHGAPLARLSQNREARLVRFCFCLLISVVRKFPGRKQRSTARFLSC